MGKPQYYLMKNKKILRLEQTERFDNLSWLVQSQLFDHTAKVMNQEEANWRVAIYRDEIMEMDEYVEYLHSPQAIIDSEMWAEAV